MPYWLDKPGVQGWACGSVRMKNDTSRSAFGRWWPALVLAVAGTAALAQGTAGEVLNVGPVLAQPGALALSRDGQVAAHLDPAGAVKLWHPATAQALPGVPAGPSPASSLALNTDGSLLATGHADGRVLLWKRGAAAPWREFRGHAARILSIDLSPDGSRLASGSEDGSTQLFDTATGRRLQVLDAVYNGHPVEGVAAPVAVAFAAGGQRLLTQERQRRQYEVGRTGTLWTLDRGLEAATYGVSAANEDADSEQPGQALGGGGWLLATSGTAQLTVQRLDGCAAARAVSQAGTDGVDGGTWADTVAADPLGRWVVAAKGAALSFFATDGPRRPRVLPLPGRLTNLVPLPDGRALLGVLSGVPREAEPPAASTAPAQGRVVRVAVPAELLAAAPLQVAADARPCPLAAAAERAQAFALPENPATLAVAARLSPDLPPLAGDPPLPLGPLQQLRFDAQGRLWALFLNLGDTRAAVAAWAPATGRAVLARELPRQNEGQWPLWLGIDWAVRDGQGGWLRAGTGQRPLPADPGAAEAFVTADADTGRLYRAKGPTLDLFTADGRRGATLRLRGPLRGLAARQGRLLALYRNGDEELFAGTPLASMAFRRAPPRWLEERADEQVERLWLSADGRYAQATIDNSHSEVPSIDIAWRLSDGQALGTGLALADLPATASRIVTPDIRAHRLAVWDWDRNEPIARLPRHRSRNAQGEPVLLQAAISDDGRRVASGSPDGLVRVWDIETHQLLGEARVGAEVTALAFDAAARRLAVGRGRGPVWLLSLPDAAAARP